jgi:hypothetical protein
MDPNLSQTIISLSVLPTILLPKGSKQHHVLIAGNTVGCKIDTRHTQHTQGTPCAGSCLKQYNLELTVRSTASVGYEEGTGDSTPLNPLASIRHDA